jgi:hypothetical protein
MATKIPMQASHPHLVAFGLAVLMVGWPPVGLSWAADATVRVCDSEPGGEACKLCRDVLKLHTCGGSGGPSSGACTTGEKCCPEGMSAYRAQLEALKERAVKLATVQRQARAAEAAFSAWRGDCNGQVEQSLSATIQMLRENADSASLPEEIGRLYDCADAEKRAVADRLRRKIDDDPTLPFNRAAHIRLSEFTTIADFELRQLQQDVLAARAGLPTVQRKLEEAADDLQSLCR